MTTYPDKPSFAIAAYAHAAIWARLEAIMRAKPEHPFTARALTSHPDIVAVAKRPNDIGEVSSVLSQMRSRGLVYKVNLDYFWKVQADAVTHPEPPPAPAIPTFLKKSNVDTPAPEAPPVTQEVSATPPPTIRTRRLRIIDGGIEISMTLGNDAKVIIDEV